MATIQQMKEYFGPRHFAFNQGIEIESVGEDGIAVCSLKLRDDQRNAFGVAQGGILFTLGDFTFAVGVNSVRPRTPTISGTVNYLTPGKGGTLRATATPISLGKTISVYEVDIVDDEGANVAYFTFTGFTRQPREKKEKPENAGEAKA
ncbi:PaaI family thioesterase [Ruminococcaceae bacterium OttesenSCG-928-O06]|nr:PaaI family thioesterase [Ruminococcaceae bacterium OttesenSCG-928-O06]